MAGVAISDFSTRCKNKKKYSAIDDIAFELEQLFSVVVASPTKRFRQYIHRPQLTSEKQDWARAKIIVISKGPLQTFFKIADILTTHLLDCIKQRQPQHRIRLGLNRALMFISDCYRYTIDHPKSKDAAQLMQIISPKDPEAHMRLGINLAMIGETPDSIHPFFHYCMFLANRNVTVGHTESDLVKKFVQTIASASPVSPGNAETESRSSFSRALIQVLWSIVSDDFNVAEHMVHDKDLWACFQRYLDYTPTGEDIQHTVGSIMFVHYRTSPHGHPEKALLDQRRLSDFLVGQVICMSCEYLEKKIEALYNSLRSRKKNRRRAMQKKRRADGTVAQIDTRLTVTTEVLRTMVELIDTMNPALGAISFLAHYWSKARSASDPSADFKPLARTFKAVRKLETALTKIEELTCTVPLISHIDSKIIDDGRGLLPALSEDIKYCTFLPCQQLQMFGHASLQQVPLLSFFQQSESGTIRDALKNIGEKSYESLVALTAKRHLEAFGLQCVKEVPSCQTFDKDVACMLVAWTIRKFRIRRLSTDLEKVAGGMLGRMSFQSSLDSGQMPSNEYIAESLPPSAQPLSAHPVVSNLHDQISPTTLGNQVRKRRRLLGNGTLPGAEESENQNSSAEIVGNHVVPESPSISGGMQELFGDWQPSKHVPETSCPQSRRPPQNSCGLLSQGTFELNYTPSKDEVRDKSKAQKKSNKAADLSAILGNILYGPEYATTSILGQPNTIAPWRRPPSDEHAQRLFDSSQLS